MNAQKLAYLVGVLATSVALAACSGGGGTIDASLPDGTPAIDAVPGIDADTTDARPADLACIGTNPTPPVVPDPIVVNGEVATVLPADSVNMAAVSAHLRSAPTIAVDTATTGTDGLYTMSVPTGANPWDGFLKAIPAQADLIDTYLYAQAPVTADLAADVPILTNANRDFFAAAASVTVETGTAIVAVNVQDCNGDSIIGATVSVSPAGNSVVTYAESGAKLPNRALTSTDDTGLAIVFNVPNPGTETTITVDYQGTQLTNAVTAWDDALVVVIVRALP